MQLCIMPVYEFSRPFTDKIGQIYMFKYMFCSVTAEIPQLYLVTCIPELVCHQLFEFGLV